jgi:hypothetical protein
MRANADRSATGQGRTAESPLSGAVIEAVPENWEEQRDIAFFRITCHLFDASFCYGASVLLASNDIDLPRVSGPR